LGSSAERPLTAGDRFALDGVLGRQKDSTARMWQVYMRHVNDQKRSKRRRIMLRILFHLGCCSCMTWWIRAG
jgi:hypothetical protein